MMPNSAEHSGPSWGQPRNYVPRIRSVIDATRPVYVGRPDQAATGQEAGLTGLQAIWDDWSGRVGLLRINGHPLATAWRLPGGNLVATAGHVMCGLLPPARNCNWFRGTLPAGATLTFADDGGNAATFPVVAYAMVHPLWDIAVLEFDPGDATLTPLPALELARDQIGAGRQIAIIGYPGRADGGVFQTEAIKHLSVGEVHSPASLAGQLLDGADWDGLLVQKPRDPARCLLLHDASTLPGYSGAPVIDVKTGALVGLHVSGVERVEPVQTRRDWNDAVDLWAATREGWLASHLGVSDAPAARPSKPLLPKPNQPVWKGGEGVTSGELQRLARRVHQLTNAADLLRGIAPDRPDDRDRAYVPSLQSPLDQVLPDPATFIGDQGGEASCAAFAVAAAIESQLSQTRRGTDTLAASVRMLDAMARDHDEFLDDTSDGTTLRAVLKGFFHNGVCREGTNPYLPGHRSDFMLTKVAADEARGLTLGAYFRVAPSLSDMQMAVQETRAVIVSAYIHAGWQPKRASRLSEISFDADQPPERTGAHAFLVVGYTEQGFIVRNSWGPKWGRWDNRPGHAIWTYADWAANVIDAWVLRLSASTPAGFDRVGGDLSPDGLHRPRRTTLLGHMVQVERDWIVEQGTIGLGRSAMVETADFLASRTGRSRYRKLAFVFHDPLMSPDLIARIAARMVPAMKAKRCYPLHVSYGLDEIRTLFLRLSADADEVRQGFAQSQAAPDRYLERRVALVAQRQVADFRAGAQQSMNGPLGQALASLVQRVLGKRREAILISVGLGAVPALACRDMIRRSESGGSFAVASPVQVPDDWTVMRLAPLDRDGRVPGYTGDWNDLLAAALGEDAWPRSPAMGPAAIMTPKWSTPEAALIDQTFIDRICG